MESKNIKSLRRWFIPLLFFGVMQLNGGKSERARQTDVLKGMGWNVRSFSDTYENDPKERAYWDSVFVARDSLACMCSPHQVAAGEK